ncbi:MAG: LysR family transcriptional regulator [Proteobacteria bacterium]|nr:MAG: LysR family transcriptional regulator [Pseudomonadota bacterium]
MELRQLRYFQAVAEEGSFSRAAERLHVSQPPLSLHVKTLEEELGVRLFDRTNRGVTLTPAGQVFFDETRAVLRRLDQAVIKAQSAGLGEVGTLSVGFVSIAGLSILPPALKRFREQFPKVDVQLHELTTDAQLPELRAGRLDLGIGLGPVDESGLTFETLGAESLLLAAPLGHRLLPPSGAVRLKTLSNEPFIIPPRDVAPGLYDLIISLCRANGFVPRITQHARQMQTVIGLVASGMGVALVPASVQNLGRPGVQYRPLRGATGQVEFGLLRARDDHSPVAGRFATVLKEVAKGAGRR